MAEYGVIERRVRFDPTKRKEDARLRAHVMRRDGFTCQYCGLAAHKVSSDYNGRYAIPTDKIGNFNLPIILEIDHIIPKSKGGSNHLDNLQVLCESCNRSKSGS